MRITQSLQAFCTILSVENFRGHCGSPIRIDTLKIMRVLADAITAPRKNQIRTVCQLARTSSQIPAGPCLPGRNSSSAATTSFRPGFRAGLTSLNRAPQARLSRVSRPARSTQRG
jgi:hypothetical protein